jgi:hypothetical protein
MECVDGDRIREWRLWFPVREIRGDAKGGIGASASGGERGWLLSVVGNRVGRTVDDSEN